MHSKFVGLAAVSAGALAAAVAAVAATQQTLTGESFLQGGGTTVNTCSGDGGSAALDSLRNHESQEPANGWSKSCVR
jgi:hypothetical protein